MGVLDFCNYVNFGNCSNLGNYSNSGDSGSIRAFTVSAAIYVELQ